jgi:hypothetical protein
LLWLAAAPGCLFAADSIVFTDTARFDATSPDRFPNGATLQVLTEGRVRPLAPGFAASADPAVSFDGTRVLFAGKQRATDPWQIWEIGVWGGSPRRVTRFPEDSITPAYLTSGKIVCARRTAFGFQLEAVELQGHFAERLTFTPGDHLVADVLRDGRILFSAPHASAGGASDLYTVYSDGSGVETYRCDHRGDRYTGVQLSSGDIIFPAGGSLARFTSGRAHQIELSPTAGEFAGQVAELSPEEWVVAYRPDGTETFGLYRWRVASVSPERLWSSPGRHAVQPVLVHARPAPNRHPSALGDRDGANLLSLNVYTSKLRIAPGSATAVRVWALDDKGRAVLLGQAPVEDDGSFYVRTPSDRGIRFELLDRAGNVVAAEKGWFWSRRGEQRVCVGCHAGPERAPENAVPAVLRRSTDPVDLLSRKEGSQ